VLRKLYRPHPPVTGIIRSKTLCFTLYYPYIPLTLKPLYHEKKPDIMYGYGFVWMYAKPGTTKSLGGDLGNGFG
jgi:hypothetical protein